MSTTPTCRIGAQAKLSPDDPFCVALVADTIGCSIERAESALRWHAENASTEEQARAFRAIVDLQTFRATERVLTEIEWTK